MTITPVALSGATPYTAAAAGDCCRTIQSPRTGEKPNEGGGGGGGGLPPAAVAEGTRSMAQEINNFIVGQACMLEQPPAAMLQWRRADCCGRRAQQYRDIARENSTVSIILTYRSEHARRVQSLLEFAYEMANYPEKTPVGR